jgi:hypothetical protein
MKAHDHPLYRRWCHWRQVCFNSQCADYPRYGGRGIGIGREFDEFWNFVDLVETHLGYPPNLSRLDKLSRIDQNKNFTIKNLKWDQPAPIGRRNSKAFRIKCRGQTHSLSTWSEITGINYSTLRARLLILGWTTAEALEFKPRRLNK